MSKIIKMDEIEKCIADHIKFLETEYGIQSEEGVLISDGSITTTMLYSTFAEKFECGLFFEGNMPFIRTKTGHTVEIREIEGKYSPNDYKLNLKRITADEGKQYFVKREKVYYKYENTFGVVTDYTNFFTGSRLEFFILDSFKKIRL